MSNPFFGSFGPVAMMGGTVQVASLSFEGHTNSVAPGSTHTFTAHATGVASGSRKTIIGITSAEATVDFSFNGVTVGGVSATEIVDSANAGSFSQAAIYIIDNPTGTTADIVVTASESLPRCSVSVWAAYDLGSSTAVSTANQFQTSSANIDLSMNVSVGDIVVAVSCTLDGSDSTTWAGLTERNDTAVAASWSYSSADLTVVTASSPLTIGCDWVGTNDAIGVAAVFR